MPEWNSFLIFVGAGLLLNINPGPDVLYIVGRSLGQGRLAGVVSALGIATGCLVLLAIEDISEIAELRRLIPICSICKKIRDDKQSWSRVENYFKEHWDLDFSHGLCPDCYRIEMGKLKKTITD